METEDCRACTWFRSLGDAADAAAQFLNATRDLPRSQAMEPLPRSEIMERLMLHYDYLYPEATPFQRDSVEYEYRKALDYLEQLDMVVYGKKEKP